VSPRVATAAYLPWHLLWYLLWPESDSEKATASPSLRRTTRAHLWYLNWYLKEAVAAYLPDLHSSESIRVPAGAQSILARGVQGGGWGRSRYPPGHGTPVYLGRRSSRREASKETCCTRKRDLLQEGCQGWGDAVRE